MTRVAEAQVEFAKQISTACEKFDTELRDISTRFEGTVIDNRDVAYIMVIAEAVRKANSKIIEKSAKLHYIN